MEYSSGTSKTCPLIQSNRQRAYAVQGVVTYMSPVEAFATGIKMESSDQGRFTRQSSGQGRFTRQSSGQGRFTRQSSDQD